MKECPFCSPLKPVLESKLAFAIFDRYPVSDGHLLIIPRRHTKTYFDLTLTEKKEIDQLIRSGKEMIDQHFQPDGYNIGINNGKAAGQTIFHVHIHLIPRYFGDIAVPRGGVRGVIPQKRIY
ncbi:HIT family protein [Thermoactinomyces mirandus]|uniref:HIT domain-containing protein n=1 Tax=Thermoactinomyces mirandus TaxID=2756294 RepID=A0A7W1XSW7_9BACL|nr:HIT domain-containing protein [Thermoactinomyces mirandus]MBA4602619.1 HIT domain-containing protein [Thermoactinomyces mirandus]